MAGKNRGRGSRGGSPKGAEGLEVPIIGKLKAVIHRGSTSIRLSLGGAEVDITFDMNRPLN